MKIGEALAEIKSKKSELTRFYSIMNDKLFRLEDEKSEIDVKTIPDAIDKLTDEIRDLKLKVLETNLHTKFDEGISLQEAILKVGDYRSKLAHYQPLFDRGSRYLYTRDGEKPKVPQLSEKENEERIKNLQRKKVKMDNKIQLLNWETDLLE